MQENNSRKRVIVISLAGLAAFMALVMMMLTFAQVPVVYAAPNALVEQCANGDQGQFRDCRETGNHGWKNSQVNTQNGHYSIGDYMPYRQILDGLVVGNEYCFGFGWDITQGNPGLPAVDYIATYSEDLDLADPTFQTIYDGDLAIPDQRVPIPDDPALQYGYWQNPANIFTGTLPATRELLVWGTTSFTFGPYGYSVLVGDPPTTVDISLAASEANSIEYCFIAEDVEVLLAWSGHISDPDEWSAPDRPGGSPYHMSNGTRQGQFTAPRTSETDLSCEDPQGVITNQNIGRNETQLQVGDTPTAINLQAINVGQEGVNPVPWMAAFIGFSLFTLFFVSRRRKSVPIE